MRRYLVTIALLLCTPAIAGRTARCEAPFPLSYPLRADWVGDEVLQAPTAGGPDAIPGRLYGLWRVSLCVKPGLHRGHAWIRYQNIHTGEIHTIGRFQKHVRPTRRRGSREVLYPRTRKSGLHWDYDWRFEHEVRRGKYVIDSVIVRDPIVFGHDDPHGHGVIRANCITYARDAWEYYSGRRIDLAILHTPEGFLRTIERDGIASPPSDLRRLPPIQKRP